MSKPTITEMRMAILRVATDDNITFHLDVELLRAAAATLERVAELVPKWRSMSDKARGEYGRDGLRLGFCATELQAVLEGE